MKVINKRIYTDKQYIELLENRIKEIEEHKRDYDLLMERHNKLFNDYKELEEENKKLKENRDKANGGLTYSDDSFLLLDNTWIIEWDYANCNDYSTYADNCSFLHDLKRWTTEEIIEECKSVIDQLEEIKISGELND